MDLYLDSFKILTCRMKWQLMVRFNITYQWKMSLDFVTHKKCRMMNYLAYIELIVAKKERHGAILFTKSQNKQNFHSLYSTYMQSTFISVYT